MGEIEKLRVLLPHWIEHNCGHEKECKQWTETAKQQGHDEIAVSIEAAVQTMKIVNQHLDDALQKAGGPMNHAHHHSHD